MAEAHDSDSVEEVQLMAEWTDERMDDLAANMTAGFDRTDRAIGELRGEISTLRTDLEREIKGVRAEMKADNASLRGEFKAGIDGLRADMSTGIDGLRAEMNAGIDGLRAEVKADLGALNAMMFRFCIAAILVMGGLATALVGVLAVGPG